MKKCKVDRELVAYIKREGTDEVVIDIVEISRKSTSYHYNGIVWNRVYPSWMTDDCVDPDGNKCKISPLNRHGVPGWVDESTLRVESRAKERYDLWQSRMIKLPGSSAVETR